MQNNMKSIFMRIHWDSLKGYADIHSLGWAFLLSTIFFSPCLFLANPQFNFFGDLAILYFPQFVEGYHMAQSGAMAGIDFLTSNGSTAYFLRPNIPVYYPPYQLTYALFHFETVESLARAFVFILYVHSFLAAYYCMRIGRKYFHMDLGASILFSVLYFGAIAYAAFTAPPFYYVAALFPFLLYFALQHFALHPTVKTAWWQMLLYSFPYVAVFLSGYAPLDVNAVLIALLFASIYFWHNKTNEERKIVPLLIGFFTPVAIAGVVVLFLYAAMFFYHKQVPGVAEGVWHSAHQFSLEAQDIFALLSRSFPSSTPGTGAPFVKLGMISVIIFIIAYSQRRKLNVALPEAKLIATSLFIFSFYLLLAFGQSSGLPDIFYFMVPVIGKMHMYGRYLLIASFFFFLAVVISFKYLVKLQGELPIGRWLSALAVIMFVAVSYSQISQPTWINLKLLVIELLMVSLMLVALSAKQSFYNYAGVIAVAFLMHAANMYSFTNSYSLAAAGPYKNDVAFSQERRDSLSKYFKQNSNKTLIKYVDITAGIEKPNGVILNFPWMVSNGQKISNYMGYEPHMALDRDYMKMFPYPYYGKINVPWLLRTGADFVIYNQAAWAINSAELEQWVDKNVPELDLWYGYKVAKLKDASGLAEYKTIRHAGDFDNGVVAIANANGSAVVTGFETDFVSHLKFKVDSPLPASVQYQLFPNKMMALYVDGKFTPTTLKDGLLEFSLPPGQHYIEYNYENWLQHLFTIIYLAYFVLLLGILSWRTWVNFGSFKSKMIKLD